MKSHHQYGFSIVEALIVLMVLATLGFISYKVVAGPKDRTGVGEHDSSQTTTPNNQDSQTVRWNFNDATNRWVPSSTPPACQNPVLPRSFIDDWSLATSVLMPGQYRGGNYKPHGGLRFDHSQASDIVVRAPLDAKLTGLTRYLESGEIQYILTFENECGIAYKFDHLYALSDKLQAIAKTTPEPKPDDTRGYPLKQTVRVTAGEIVATAVGHPATHNIGMDFGVYDYRSPNAISHNKRWAAIHSQYEASEWYGRCWFDMLPSTDASKVKKLPAGDQRSGVRSDYCSNPLGNTLGVNGGQPL